MAGQFIISLDCEGKWSMADVLQPHHNELITHANLVQVYRFLAKALDDTEIPATFAFVLAFILEKSEIQTAKDLFHPAETEAQTWLANYHRAISEGASDGWHCPEALELAQRNSRNEIGCHGFSHLPLSDSLATKAAVRAELTSANIVAQWKNLALKTLVFPRNLVGHIDVLEEHQYIGYRTDLAQTMGANPTRMRALLNEFNVFTKAQAPLAKMNNSAGTSPHQIEAIPAGYILNFAAGGRKIVPPSVTLQRWKSILNSAVENDQVALIWFHPHNLINSPHTQTLLTKILQYAAHLRDTRNLQCVTQAEYCAGQQNPHQTPQR